MAGYDVSGFGGALKIDYEDIIADAVPDKSYLLTTLDDATDDVDFAGTTINFAVDLDANQSYGINTMDGSAVPAAGRRNIQQASVNVSNHAVTTSVTDEVILRSQKSEGAFISATEKIAKDVSKDLAKRVNQALYGKVLWNIASDSSGTTLTLNSVQYLRVGDVIVVGNRTSGAVTGSRTITARSIANKTVTIDSSITATAATDGVWYSGAGPSDTKFIEGLRWATQGASRTLHNLASGTYANWAGNEINANGAEVGEQTVIKLLDTIYEREIGEATDALASPGVRTRLAKDLMSQKRFQASSDTVKLPGGFSAIMVNEVPVVRDSDSTKGFLFAWDRKAVKTVKMGKAGWMEAPDGKGSIFVEGRNASGQRLTSWEATYRMYLNLLFVAPGATGQIFGAADDNPVN